ncbi:MAG: DUF5615 family PIN-like protein [Gammaproteobacteria bacterium]
MNVVCDVHIPYRLVNFLRERGINATHANRLPGGSASTDAQITSYVDEHNAVLITKDGDFRDHHLFTGTR